MKRRARATSARPTLTPRTSLADFCEHYWYLAELVAFCRRHGLGADGPKLEIVRRVERFLHDGGRATRERRPTRASARLVERPTVIELDTPVTAAYRCDAPTRAFFERVIGPHFHFTAHLQRFRRERERAGVALTYGDLVREWVADHERRKRGTHDRYLAPTWEYNRFTRDFLADRERNAGKGIADAARAWTVVRDRRGTRSYAEYLKTTDRPRARRG